jgi:hypothetical protein
MVMLRRLLRPRKNPRFYTHKGVFVVVGPHTTSRRKIQILDISEGGCAFIYNGTRKELEESGFLSLVVDETHYLDRLDFVTKSDSPLPETQKNSQWLRRRGVAFKWLGEINRKRLKEFIDQNTTGRAS